MRISDWSSDVCSSDLPEPRPLRGGDLCVFPRGGWHLLTPDGAPRAPGSRFGERGSGAFTDLVCGAFELEEGTSSALLDALPNVIVVPTEQVDAGFGALLHLLEIGRDQR